MFLVPLVITADDVRSEYFDDAPLIGNLFLA